MQRLRFKGISLDTHTRSFTRAPHLACNGQKNNIVSKFIISCLQIACGFPQGTTRPLRHASNDDDDDDGGNDDDDDDDGDDDNGDRNDDDVP